MRRTRLKVKRPLLLYIAPICPLFRRFANFSTREVNPPRRQSRHATDPLRTRVLDIVLARIVRAAERIVITLKCKDDEKHIVEVDDAIELLERLM